jgi:Co/Zn/Cd efflux system component
VLEADPMVSDAHHLHVRSLGGDTLSLTGHVRVASDQLHDAETVTRRLSDALGERGIAHVTLQAECHPCDEPEC